MTAPPEMHPSIQEAKLAALEVLLHNACGPYDGLPRTAGWGYPEPYTRDLLISALGIFASGNEMPSFTKAFAVGVGAARTRNSFELGLSADSASLASRRGFVGRTGII